MADQVISGSGELQVDNVGDSKGTLSFQGNSISITNVDASQISAANFSANPGILNQQTWEIDVNYDLIGYDNDSLPEGTDTIYLNPTPNENPSGGGLTDPTTITGGTIYVWYTPPGGQKKAIIKGRMTYQPVLRNR